MHTKQRKEKYVVVSSIRSELPLCPQKGYFLFILFKLFPKLSNIWWGKKTKHFTQVSIVMSGPEKNYKLNTYVLSVYFCAARSRSSRAPSSSSSSSLSVKSSGWLPRCGGGPWHPLVLLWPLSSPLHPPFACLPPPSASPPPVAQTSRKADVPCRSKRRVRALPGKVSPFLFACRGQPWRSRRAPAVFPFE